MGLHVRKNSVPKYALRRRPLRKTLACICMALALTVLCTSQRAGAAPRSKADKHDKAAEPPPVPGEVVVDLDGTADQVRSGAAGRLLIFHVKGSDKLTVVDAVAGKIVKQVPAPGDFHYAADADKLLLVLNNQRAVQRWDLKTMEREKTVLLPDDRPIRLVAMGSAGYGPLAVWPVGKVEFWDVATLKPLAVSGKVEDQGQGNLWPSADGLTFASWGWSTVPYDIMQLSHVTASSADCDIIHTPDGEDYNESWAMPSADGSMLIRHGARPYNLLTPQVSPIEPGPLKGATLLPTEDPRFLLALRRIDPYKSEGNTCAIVAAVDLRVLYTIRDVEPVTGGMIGSQAGRFGPEPRVHYFPREKLLVTIPESDDKVVVRPFDLKQSLEATGADYLFVISKPHTRLRPGEAFNYQVETLSRAGGIKYKLEEAPDGMKVSDSGLITWKAAAAGKADVILDVTDASGQEVQHTIVLYVMKPPEEAAVAAPNKGGAAARLKGVWTATPVFDPEKVRKLVGKDLPADQVDAAVADFKKKMAGFKIVYAFNEDGTAVGRFGTDADSHGGRATWKVLKEIGDTARIGITPEGGKPEEMDLTFAGPDQFAMDLPGPDLPVRTPVYFDRSDGPAPAVGSKPGAAPRSDAGPAAAPRAAPANAAFHLMPDLSADDRRSADAVTRPIWANGHSTLKFEQVVPRPGSEGVSFTVHQTYHFPAGANGKTDDSTFPAELHNGLMLYSTLQRTYDSARSPGNADVKP
jgi:hypothetical protein